MAEKIRKSFRPMIHKNYENAVRIFLSNECKFMGGPRVLDLVVHTISEIAQEYFVPKEYMGSGDLLWTAVTTDMRNASSKMEDAQKKVVRLPIVDHEKIMGLIERTPIREIKKKMVAKMAKAAYEQGTTLSSSDIAAIMNCSPSTVSKYSREIAEEQEEPLPLRGFVHDIGPSLSHKITVVRAYLQGKTGNAVAKETRHSLQACGRYVKGYEKVRIAKKYCDDLTEIAFVTGQSKRLVKEYIFLMEQFQNQTKNYIKEDEEYNSGAI